MSDVGGCDGQRGFAEIKVKVDFSMESKKVPAVFGCDEQHGFADMTLKVDLSMESRMYGFSKENNRFHVCLGATDSADSQKS